MRRLFAFVEYDGTELAGFQVQARGRTVQGELELALHKITGETVRVTGGGRTDSGVHALGQGAHWDTNWDRPLNVLERALNAVLPNDIAVHGVREVPRDFSARYSAQSRVYRYTILNQPTRAPLARRYGWHIAEPLDVDAMDAAAQSLIGTHDFGAFGTPPRGDNTVRAMLKASVRRDVTRVFIELEANAFLYRMVRRIVGTLVLVGKGEMTLTQFRLVLAKEKRAGQSAPPQGLCLVVVKYELTDKSAIRFIGAKDENI
ncbi:MAG: tRNA pseudouridine(38-40) synthase TruA [Chloroflexi bacterium]|nr:tRNA pseudouridine(38-40) synthase TruA [Chloroflexota bacterium]